MGKQKRYALSRCEMATFVSRTRAERTMIGRGRMHYARWLMGAPPDRVGAPEMRASEAAGHCLMLSMSCYIVALVPILFIGALSLRNYRSKKGSALESFRAGCDRASMREEAQHPFAKP